MTIGRESGLAGRMRRQGLTEPARTRDDYETLFRRLQPVSPIYFSYPGSPPGLVHRAAFDDQRVADEWRRTRKIVKGRFLRGTIGYVFGDELALYANAFQRPLERFDRKQQILYDVLAHVGPLTPRQIKEETGLLNKEIMPVLHRLQQAFLVYEDQSDSDWERPWYVFSQEWPDVEVNSDLCEQAALEVLRRFLHAHFFATSQEIKDWSGWPARDIKHLLGSLESDGSVIACSPDGLGDGWIRSEDTALDEGTPAHSALMLHKADPLVSARMSELKSRFAGLEVLQYLLIDGEFRGAVCGHWRIGPHDVDDIVVDLPADERIARRDEIITAVAWRYHPPSHRILRCCGEPVTARQL